MNQKKRILMKNLRGLCWVILWYCQIFLNPRKPQHPFIISICFPTWNLLKNLRRLCAGWGIYSWVHRNAYSEWGWLSWGPGALEWPPWTFNSLCKWWPGNLRPLIGMQRCEESIMKDNFKDGTKGFPPIYACDFCKPFNFFLITLFW